MAKQKQNSFLCAAAFLAALVGTVILGARPSMGSELPLNTCVTSKDPIQTIATCTQLINNGQVLGHDLAVAYNSRGAAYVADLKYDLAITDFTAALESDVRFVEAYVNRAFAYSETSRYDLAVADAGQALRINPEFSIAYYARGIAFSRQGQYDLAIADFNHVLLRSPNNRVILGGRAIAYFGDGQYLKAAADYDEVIVGDPSNSRLYDDRGRVFFAMGNFANAIRDFSSAISYDHTNAYAVLWLHMSRSRVGSPQLQEFATNVAALDQSKWPMPVIRLYLGKNTFAAVASLATGAGQKCEAYFYSAELNIIRDDTAHARPALDAARTICPREYGEYYVAQAELARIAGSSR